MFNRALAIVDVETTGLSPIHDRIIELCILRVEEGVIVDKLNTLINPGVYIPPYIQSITNISPADLELAPIFFEVEDRAHELLKDALFVAHNVNFDYSFIRHEFKRIEKSFSSKTLCTARLSRKLFPRHRRHNLSAIIERFGFECSRRHRAYDDAFVLYEFLNLIKDKLEDNLFEQTIRDASRTSFSSNKILNDQINELPECAGVYIFYDKSGSPLYVGKSTNIKNRVKSHFAPTIISSHDQNIIQKTADVTHIKTAGELGALIKESQLIKDLHPTFNRRLRLKKEYVALIKSKTSKGYDTLTLTKINSFEEIDFSKILKIFNTLKSAKEFLVTLAKDYQLCLNVLGIENSPKECFQFKLGKCRGACVDKESSQKYNQRFTIVFIENREFEPWSFNGPIDIIEKNEEFELCEKFTVDKWCLKNNPFDLDIYKILRTFVKKKRPIQKSHQELNSAREYYDI